MKKIFVILFLYKMLIGSLIPDNFMSNPDIQRAGFEITQEYFDRTLFNNVYGIAFTRLRNTTPQGELMVSSDCGWHRLIYVYLEEEGDQSASWIKAYGKFGNGSGRFDEPMGLCIDTTIYGGISEEYTVYVADRCNDRVVRLKYNVNTETLVNAGILGSNLSKPKDVACVSKSDGGAYVVIVEEGNDRISLYGTQPNGTAYLVQRYGELGAGSGKFGNPSGVAICEATDGQGGYYVYISDTGNNRIVCLRFQPGQGISWERSYTEIGDPKFLSVTASQYYCVYVTAFMENKIYVFTPGLTELLYTYGDENLLNGPKDIYIDWDRIGLTEKWTAITGIQYFKIIPEIREFHPDPEIFDATEDSVQINFRVDETAHNLTITVADDTLIDNQYYTPGYYSFYWNGRNAGGNLFLPGVYAIKIFCQNSCIEIAEVTVKGTQVSGTLSEDEHWTAVGEPYVLTGDVILPSNGRLEIDPGVKVMPTGDYAIKTNEGWQTSNKLIANGTVLNPILFTPHRKINADTVVSGSWMGIWFYNNYNTDSLVLEHCIIEGAGSDSTAVFSKVCPAYISNTKISRSGGFGLYIMADSSYISNCQFEDNDSIPILIRFNSIGRITGNVFVDNNPDVIGVWAKDLHTDATIHNQSVPYWFLTHTSYGPNFTVYRQNDIATLTIEPGTNIQCDDEIRLIIGGASETSRGKIIAQGTEADSIIFTAIDTTKPWLGIHLYSYNPQDTSIFEYCIMSHGWKSIPYPPYGQGILGCYKAHNPFILRNSIIKRSRGVGFNYYTTGTDISVNPEIKNNQFIDNDSFPIIIPANYLRKMESNSFIDNRNNTIYVKNDNRINKSLIWRNQGIPYLIDHCMQINGTGDTIVTVEIESGTVLKFNSGSCRLQIYGDDSLIAQNTTFLPSDPNPENPCYAFVHLNPESNAIIDSCTFEGSWGYYYYDAAVRADGYCCTEITNSKFIRNRTGVSIGNNGMMSSIYLENNQLLLNETGMLIRDTEPTSAYIQQNDFIGNKCAMWSESGTWVIPAENNYWGDATGPWDPISGDPLYNPGGKGDSIGAYIDYQPWLTSPVHNDETVTLVQPNGGEILYNGMNYDIQWSKSVTPTKQELYYTTDFPEGGGSKEDFLWTFIDTVNVSSNTYQWEIPATPSNRCRVAIKLHYESGSKENNRQKQPSYESESNIANDEYVSSNSRCINELYGKTHSRDIGSISVDISDANFVIVDTVSPQITLSYPTGSEYFIPTEQETIQWQASDNHRLDHFNIYLSEDGGFSYPETITEDLEAPCSTYAWTVPEKNNYKCKIMVVAYDSSANDNNDVCDSIFYIPIKSFSDEMSAYNNAVRLIRSFSTNLHLVYSSVGSAALSNKQDMPGDQYSPHHPEQFRGQLRGDDIYYTKSTNLGETWQSPTDIGDGICPSMAMNSNASKLGVAWTNSGETKILYQYYGMFGWSSTYTIINTVSGVEYSPVAIQFASDTIHMTTLRTTTISRTEIIQDVLYIKFPWTGPGMSAPFIVGLDHWRIKYDGTWPEFTSIAVDGNNFAHLAWERPPDDTVFNSYTPSDIFYIKTGPFGPSAKFNVSDTDSNSINPSIECYGGHYYIVWQEKLNGYNIFLYKRNYVGFPPSYQTDTISQSAGKYPVTSMGGVVLWAAGDTADIYGRIWDSQGEKWLGITNWSNTPRHSMHPQVDAWQDEGGIDIIAGWTEDTDTSGFGKKFVSIFPYGDYGNISFPSYFLDLGDSLSTPFTEHRDTVASYGIHRFDCGEDSLVYLLPNINQYAKCRFYAQLYRPDSCKIADKGSKWKIKLNIDNIVYRIIKLNPGQTVEIDIDIPWSVNADGLARVLFAREKGDHILLRRVMLYEYERIGEIGGALLAGGGPQTTEDIPTEVVFFRGIYPNPSRGDINVRLNITSQEDVKVTLYDVAGRLLDELHVFESNKGLFDIPIKTRELPTGVYFVSVDANGVTITKKAILLK